MYYDVKRKPDSGYQGQLWITLEKRADDWQGLNMNAPIEDESFLGGAQNHSSFKRVSSTRSLCFPAYSFDAQFSVVSK
jgi:hypothetical protein